MRARSMTLALFVAGCAGGSESTAPEAINPYGDAASAGDLSITVDAERNELVLEMEPVDLPAMTAAAAEHEHAGAEPPPQYGAIPVTGWLHGYAVELTDAAGNQVPNALIHHVNIIAPDRRELFSPIMQRLGAAGSETGPVKLPGLLGYPVRRGDRVLLTGMLHNATPTAYEAVRIRVRLPMSTGRRVPPLRVYPFYLDVMPPASVHRFDLPPGRSQMSWEGRPAVSGRILGMGGHLHRYAIALRLEDVTRGVVLWETQPIVNAAGEIVAMPQRILWSRGGLAIHSDRVYRLTALYDNPTPDTIRDGGMGALGGIVLPERGRAWPGVDATDAEYVLDVRLTESGGRLDGVAHGAGGAEGAKPAEAGPRAQPPKSHAH